MPGDDNDDEQAPKDLLATAKAQKTKAKSAFTKQRNRLIRLLHSDNVSNKSVVERENEELELVFDDVTEKLDALLPLLTEPALHDGVLQEIETIDSDYNDTIRLYNDWMQRQEKPKENDGWSSSSEESEADSARAAGKDKKELTKDMWKMLKRVEIPTFCGEKHKYENWKAAFNACIDQAPATPEFKLLQLRQYLRGDALKVIEHLGHSATAYKAARERLEREFGGKRRQVAIYLEELDSFPTVRNGNARDLKQFANLLDVAVVNLEEAGKVSELSDGLLYAKLQKKLPEVMVARYRRWLHEYTKMENVKELREWVLLESAFQTEAMEIVQGVSQVTIERPRRNESRQKSFVSISQHDDCKVCGGRHELWACEKFKQKCPDDRWKAAVESQACFRCLSRGHQAQKCRRSQRCGVNGCKRSHHSLLHSDHASTQSQPVTSTASAPQEKAKSEAAATHQESKSTVSARTMMSQGAGGTSLRTIPVVISNGTRQMKINALLDDASTRTYVNSAVASELGLQGQSHRVQVNVLNGQAETFVTTPVTFTLETNQKQSKVAVTAFTADNVTGDLRATDWKKLAPNWEHLKEIPFPKPHNPTVIDLLIGADYPELHVSWKEVSGNHGEPQARLTPLGWTCIGTSISQSEITHFASTFFSNAQSNQLFPLLKQFWEVEEVSASSKPCVSPDDKSALKQAEETLAFENGRYRIGIPWRAERQHPHDSYSMAMRRLSTTERRLLKDEDVKKQYQAVIDKYLEQGYICKVPQTELTDRCFLPHFPVLRPDKSTTKVRIVFDASAESAGTALNDHILPGPKLQRDLVDVLLRFRRYPVAIACDVAEMYLQIEMLPEDRPLHSFLWRDVNQLKPPEVYEFNRVVFGVTSSPFLAQFVTRTHAEKLKTELPLAAETVLKSTYMDDSLDSARDEVTGIKLYQELVELWHRAGMHARKFVTNSEAVLDQIPPGDRATDVDIEGKQSPSTKTLGVVWQSKPDILTFKTDFDKPITATKRGLLRRLATVFDPLGLIAPFTVHAKMLLQELWQSGLGWDDRLDDVLMEKVQAWEAELSVLDQVRVPRSLSMPGSEKSPILHTFVDASEKAYGAVCYLRSEDSAGSGSVRFVTAKTRVAPVTAMSIPRLELMAAVLGQQLANKVSEALELDINEAVFWSDSMNVLYWVRGQGRTFKPFVAHRIGEIQASSDPSQWRHVPTDQNPADLLSRGESVAKLINSSFWWYGPEFLTLNMDNWPTTNIKADHRQAHSEHRHSYMQMNQTFVTIDKNEVPGLSPDHFSSWTRLARVRAWVTRFISNCRRAAEHRQGGELLPTEIEAAEFKIITEAQADAFSEDLAELRAGKSVHPRSKLASLNPKIDNFGLLRADSRLSLADVLPFSTRMPIILPRSHPVTELLVKYHHEQVGHLGTNQTLAALSVKFWIVAAREAIKNWESKCSECRRQKAQPACQIMAPLPPGRVTEPLRAFARISVDFGGPFLTKQGRGRVRQKRYLALFTCMATRAVHIEMAFGLDTDSFLNALHRMISRRGRPLEIYSDNGTNFVGAERELRELVRELNQEKLQQQTAQDKIAWHFNPPAAPHFGGVHEIMIKAAKRAIWATLKDADVNDEELLNAFIGAEALLNTRPLTYQSAHPKDDTPLTPNHFLVGQAGGQLAPEIDTEEAQDPSRRWRRVQHLIGQFWRRWIREWLPSLGLRSKWRREMPDIKAGDVVLLVCSDSPRGRWPLARVLDVMTGPDGHVRVVKVQVGERTFTRPVTKVCPLFTGE